MTIPLRGKCPVCNTAGVWKYDFDERQIESLQEFGAATFADTYGCQHCHSWLLIVVHSKVTAEIYPPIAAVALGVGEYPDDDETVRS